jgi:hypothetical protein
MVLITDTKTRMVAASVGQSHMGLILPMVLVLVMVAAEGLVTLMVRGSGYHAILLLVLRV